MPPLTESVLEGPIPRAEVPRWREQYGVVAGITRKPYDLGLWTKDPVGEVSTRWREFRRVEPGFGLHVLGNQVHGTEIARSRQPTADGPRSTMITLEGVDGHLTSDRGTMLCVTVADCTPVYLLALDRASERPLSVALLHAGWRGTAGGILKKGVELLLAAQPSSRLVCHLGVSICGPCYEVGPEVFDAMAPWADDQRPQAPGPRPAKGQLDVRAVLAKQAAALGIDEVTTSIHCTRHGEGWYSHRGADAGRMVGYLGLTP
jgi:copper oxidase (laccase) domain-containing protein